MADLKDQLEEIARNMANVHRGGSKRRTSDKIVARIIKLHKEGHSSQSIANILIEENIPAPGGGSKWWPSVISNIIISETKHD